jgi:transposase-like protein
MSAINATSEPNNGLIYPVNGVTPTKWGRQYDRNTRARIVNDIASGLITVSEMSEMIGVNKSFILDWGRAYRRDYFGPPRHKKKNPMLPAIERGLSNKGQHLSIAERKEIVSQIISGSMTIPEAYAKHKVYPSSIKAWCQSEKYRKTDVSAPAPEPITKTFPADRLANSPKHSRIVLDLLLNGSTEQALVVARAFLATI